MPDSNTRLIKSSGNTERLIVFIRWWSLAAYAPSLSLIGWRWPCWVASGSECRVLESGCVCVWGGVWEGYVHVKRVIEMESKHRRKIITCQAWVVMGNELHRAERWFCWMNRTCSGGEQKPPQLGGNCRYVTPHLPPPPPTHTHTQSHLETHVK